MELTNTYQKLYDEVPLEYSLKDVFLSKNRNLVFLDRFGIAFKVKNKILCFSDNPKYVYNCNQCWFTEDLFMITFKVYQKNEELKKCAAKATQIEKPIDLNNLSIFEIMKDKELKYKVFISDNKYFKLINGSWCSGETIETIDKWNMPDVTLQELKRTYKLITQ